MKQDRRRMAPRSFGKTLAPLAVFVTLAREREFFVHYFTPPWERSSAMENEKKAGVMEEQIKELIAIDALRTAKGLGGIHVNLSAFIAWLWAKMGSDPRMIQAKVLFWKGFAKDLGFLSFEEYLATIPQVPDCPESWKNRFKYPVLVDARMSLAKACALLGISCRADDVIDAYQASETLDVYWIWCYDGVRIHGTKTGGAATYFLDNETDVGLSVLEGIAFYAQFPEVLEKYDIRLLGAGSAGCHCIPNPNNKYSFVSLVLAERRVTLIVGESSWLNHRFSTSVAKCKWGQSTSLSSFYRA